MSRLKRPKLAVGAFLLLTVAGLGYWTSVLSPYARAFARSTEDLLGTARKVYDYASPEYQREVLTSASPNPLNGPFYRFDDNLEHAVVVNEPKLPASGTDSGIVFRLEFDDSDGVELVTQTPEGSRQIVANGVVSLHDTLANALLSTSVPVDIPFDEVGSILLRARSDRVTALTIAWSKEDDPGNPAANRMSIDLVGDGEFHTYDINASNALKRGLRSGDRIRSLFITASDRHVDFVEIDFLRFVSKLSEYSMATRGVGYETIEGEMRRVLYMLPSQTLDFSLLVPEDSPTLEFGAAALMDHPSMVFSVFVLGDGEEELVYHLTDGAAGNWRDSVVDLSRWAGRDIRIRFTVTGESGNVAFLSSPIVNSRPRQPFNVIVILEDALRADHLSTYGYGRVTSPVKDSLMKTGGVVFHNAVSQATKTRPSVPALMTSLFPSATGVWHWDDMLNENYLTLAEVMRSQGFMTASFVQNGNAGPYAGLHQGFSVLWDRDRIGTTTEDILGGQVLEWLEASRHRNFFAYLHVTDPHGVYDPPKPFDNWFRQTQGEGTPIRDPSNRIGRSVVADLTAP